MGKYCFTYDCKSLCIGIGIWKSFVRFHSLYNCLISEVQKGPILLIGVSTFDFFFCQPVHCVQVPAYSWTWVLGKTANLPQKSLHHYSPVSLFIVSLLVSLVFRQRGSWASFKNSRWSMSVTSPSIYSRSLAASWKTDRQLAQDVGGVHPEPERRFVRKEKKLEVSTRQRQTQTPQVYLLGAHIRRGFIMP